MSGSYQKIEGSAELVNSSQDLFAHPPTHTSTLEGAWTEIIPTTISDTGDIQIDIPASSVNCFNLADSYLSIQTKVVKADGTDLPASRDNVVVCPNDAFVHSLFKRVDMYINEYLVESETNYPFRAYLEDLLNYSKGAKKSKLKLLSGWHEDANLAKDGGEHDDNVFKARADAIKSSPTLTFCSRLHLDMFHQRRLITPRNTLRLFFERASPKFSLMAQTDTPQSGAQVLIKKCSLFLRTAKLNPSLQSSINKMMLAGNSATYPIDRVDASFYTIPAGASHEDRVLKGNGQLPSKVIVVLVNQLAINGAYKLNPFRFKDYTLSSIELSADGSLVDRYEPNFEQNNFGREYFQALAINNKEIEDSETITPEEYKEGRTVFAFDLTKDREDGPHLISTGSLNLKMVFRDALPHTVSFMVYTIKDDEVMIDVTQRVSRTGDKVGS